LPGLLLWIRHPPYTSAHLGEAVRIMAMTTALGAAARCLFIGEGVRALVQGQEPYLLGPPLERLLLEVVTPENPALVHQGSLDARALAPERLIPSIPWVRAGDRQVAEALVSADRVVPL
jgi:sulfur relay (sulfurtransferase) DsrF/TusC family protein